MADIHGNFAAFQFTPLREGRRVQSTNQSGLRLFQFTPLREGRHIAKAVSGLPPTFQFTPLREGRHLSRWQTPFRTSFQFTPLREGRLSNEMRKLQTNLISIHAPPRGATGRYVEIHGHRGYFNSRPSARGDASRRRVLPRSNDFNSRPSARGDDGKKYATGEKNIFQFTPLREGRQERREPGRNADDFNSRPSARGDTGLNAEQIYYFISIHAPPRGATSSWKDKPSAGISIHAPPRGATDCIRCKVDVLYFNSRPSARGDLSVCVSAAKARRFQFTPLREGRHEAIEDEKKALEISIHAPPRGAT